MDEYNFNLMINHYIQKNNSKDKLSYTITISILRFDKLVDWTNFWQYNIYILVEMYNKYIF